MKYALGTRVRKTKGASWQGTVVGHYSTTLTPDGVCVESEREPGSVQIYPVAALEEISSEPVGRSIQRTDDATADFATALQIFRKDGRLDSVSPFHCEHDVLTVMADPANFTEAEIKDLDELGFDVGDEFDDDCFSSFRFGSA
nr:hypothetical protein [Rhodococcus sp. (in: high G+C Gram-positive bacteria)]